MTEYFSKGRKLYETSLPDAILELIKLWKSGESISGYERLSDTDLQNYFLLWEGTEGEYIFDFYDWNNEAFFEEHVNGFYGYFYISRKQGFISISLNGSFLGRYSSATRLLADLKTRWEALPFRQDKKK